MKIAVGHRLHLDQVLAFGTSDVGSGLERKQFDDCLERYFGLVVKSGTPYRRGGTFQVGPKDGEQSCNEVSGNSYETANIIPFKRKHVQTPCKNPGAVNIPGSRWRQRAPASGLDKEDRVCSLEGLVCLLHTTTGSRVDHDAK